MNCNNERASKDNNDKWEKDKEFGKTCIQGQSEREKAMKCGAKSVTQPPVYID